ncbi:MAG: DUF1491 family protein [Pseudomonadota bacterium]
MTTPRLKTEIRVQAHLRRARAGGAFATVARKGDPDAGAVAVKVYLGGGRARAFLRSVDLDGNPVWRNPFTEESGAGDAAGGDEEGGDVAESDVDARLAKEVSYDPDLWIIEIEDRDGRAFLE